MNKLDFWLVDDPREKVLRDAIYRAIARKGRQSAPHAVVSVEAAGRQPATV